MKRLPTSVLILVLAAACARVRSYETASRPAGSRDAYEDQLLKSDLRSSRAYNDWIIAGRRALRDRLSIRPSFREIVHFSPDHATAVGYRLDLRRGQRVRIAVEKHMRARVFSEVFEEIGPGDPIFRLVYSSSLPQSTVDFEARTDGPHVIRLQPELFKGGEVVVTITTAASLTFPVTGRTARAIGSYFGDLRDGGKRDHEGVDIFAPASTPVVAVADGVVTSVATTPIGGNVIWQEDARRGVTYYYAHLSTQSVRRGDFVRAGEEVGTVGNTGNAKTTPSHLHFAVYRPGRFAIDPVPFLFDQPSDPVRPVVVDLSVLGDSRFASADGVPVRFAPGADAAAVTRVGRGDELYIIGGVKDWYRVVLADGRAGFVQGSDIGSYYLVKGAH